MLKRILPPFIYEALRQLVFPKKTNTWELFTKKYESILDMRYSGSQGIAQEEAEWFIKCFEEFKSKNTIFESLTIAPIFYDLHAISGTMHGHYFHQDLFVAQKIFQKFPVRHVDIGSRQDGFVAHVASFRAIEIIDIRPQPSEVKNVIFRKADLTKLDKDLIEYSDSISSLHAVEHFGLGRYGDALDEEGHLKAVDNIHKMLKVNGTFYFSVPIGEMRIEFNAHRVFSIKYLVAWLTQSFKIEEFAYVDDEGLLHTSIPLEDLMSDSNNLGCHMGCGIFILRKK